MNNEKFNFKLILALTFYLVSLFASNTLGLKIMPFLFGTHLSVAVFFFPFVFITTDVVGQVYGKKMAKNFVWAGFISILVFMIFSLVSLAMPWAEEGLWAKDGFNTIFAVSFRLSIASLLAYIMAAYQDVLTFFYFRRKLKGHAFWLTSNLSNLWSQLIDTIVFMAVAFIGVYSIPTLIMMSIPWYLFKILMGVLYTPLSYIGIKLLKDDNQTTQNETISA